MGLSELLQENLQDNRRNGQEESDIVEQACTTYGLRAAFHVACKSFSIRVDKNHDFFKNIKKSDLFDLNQVFFIFVIFLCNV